MLNQSFDEYNLQWILHKLTSDTGELLEPKVRAERERYIQARRLEDGYYSLGNMLTGKAGSLRERLMNMERSLF
ncbi:MAG: hypothetical protein ACE5FT_03890 [Candidatus Nanoarchaeia archaeon]